MAYARLTAFCFQVSFDLFRPSQPPLFCFALVCLTVMPLTLLCCEHILFYYYQTTGPLGQHLHAPIPVPNPMPLPYTCPHSLAYMRTGQHAEKKGTAELARSAI